MKTFQQKVNGARKKVQKFMTDLEGLMNKMDAVCEDLEDDDFNDKMGEITEVFSGILEGDARTSFPDIIDYLDELSERESEED